MKSSIPRIKKSLQLRLGVNMLKERVGRVEQAAGSGCVVLYKCYCRHFLRERFLRLDIELGLHSITSSHQFAASCASPLSWQPEVSPTHDPELGFTAWVSRIFQLRCRLNYPTLASLVGLCHSSLCVWQDQQFFVQFVHMDIVINEKKTEEMLMEISKINNLTVVWKCLFY